MIYFLIIDQSNYANFIEEIPTIYMKMFESEIFAMNNTLFYYKNELTISYESYDEFSNDSSYDLVRKKLNSTI